MAVDIRKVKDLRIEHKLTQKEFANKLNVSESAVSMWERGERSITFEKSDDIARLFGVALTDILEEKKSTQDEYSFEERSLVNSWRHADDQTRRIVAYALGLMEGGKHGNNNDRN